MSISTGSRAALFVLALFLVTADVFAANVSIEFKSGRKIEGELVKEDDVQVVVKLKFGSITYEKSEIKKITRLDAGGGGDAAVKVADKFDVINLNNGLSHKGIIIKETDSSIEFDIIRLSTTGGKPMVIRMTFSKSKIKDVVRITEKQRAQMIAYIKSPSSKSMGGSTSTTSSKTTSAKTIRAVSPNVRVTKGTWDRGGRRGKVKISKVTIGKCCIETNIKNIEFVKRSAARIGSVFKALEATLGADRNLDKKVRIIILDSMTDYKSASGFETRHPAYYDMNRGIIYAGMDTKGFLKEEKDEEEEEEDDDGFSYAASRLNRQDFGYEQWRNDGVIIKAFEVYEKEAFKLERINRSIASLEEERDEQLEEINALLIRNNYVKYDKTKYEPDDPRSKAVTPSEKKSKIDAVNKEFSRKLMAIKGKRLRLLKSIEKYRNNFLDALASPCVERVCHEAYHAYVNNYLYDEDTVVNIPTWLNMGLAQYYASIKIKRGRAILNSSNENILNIINLYAKNKEDCSIDHMLNATPEAFVIEKAERGYIPTHFVSVWEDAFGEASTKVQDRLTEKRYRASKLNYFQSWLVVHILGDKERITSSNIKDYIKALCTGGDKVKAFEGFAGMSVYKMEEEMKSYTRKNYF